MDGMVRSLHQGKDKHICIHMHVHIHSLYEESFILQSRKLETATVLVVMQKKKENIAFGEK